MSQPLSNFPQLYPAENTGITRPAPRPGPVIGGMSPGIAASIFPPNNTSSPNQGQYTIYTIDLTNAPAAQIEYDTPGGLLSLWDTTVPATDLITIRFNDPASDPIPFRYGKAFELFNFTKFFVNWVATAGSTATILVMPPKPQRTELITP